MRVGPESAGADPGPACYGRGGPLTLTDVQVLLGHLRPDTLPAVFGRDGRSPIDPGEVERRFAALTARESEVLAHVVHGKMNKQIAAALGIHERTVKLHRSAITTKLGVRSVAELTTLTRQSARFAETQQPCP